LDAVDIRKEIAISKATLEPYRLYGQLVIDAINAFARLEEVMANPSDEGVAEGIEIATELNRRLAPYRGYVPQIAKTVDEVLKWMQDRR
jgi:hypothetical protein